MKVRKAAFVFFFFFKKIFSSRKGTHVVEFYLAENDCTFHSPASYVHHRV